MEEIIARSHADRQMKNTGDPWASIFQYLVVPIQTMTVKQGVNCNSLTQWDHQIFGAMEK